MPLPFDPTDDKDTELLNYLSGQTHAAFLKQFKAECYLLRDIQRRQRRAAALDTQGNHPRPTMAVKTPSLPGRTTQATNATRADRR
jgi:hypothetical protein